jgi:hypothetical protein
MTKNYLDKENYIDEEIDEEWNSSAYERMQEDLKRDTITNAIFEMKYEMLDYVSEQAVPLLEKFNMDVWEQFIERLM